MENHSDPNIKWLWSRLQPATTWNGSPGSMGEYNRPGDISDAGMTYYVVSGMGNQDATSTLVKELLENPDPPAVGNNAFRANMTAVAGSSVIGFNRQGTSFTLPSASAYSLSLFDLEGRLIATSNGMGTAGKNTDNTLGRSVKSGYYVLRLNAGGISNLQKVAIH